MQLAGLGSSEREKMAEILRGTKGTVSVEDASRILEVPSSTAARLLSQWARKGWLSRVRRGLYVPVPLEARTTDVSLEDPWLIAERLFAPCYVGGWSAAEYWDLTEQIFRTVVVMTTQRPRNRRPAIKGTTFMLRTIPAKAMFGLKAVWRGQVKVWISDPARTVVDMLNDPRLAGGARPLADVLGNYLRSEGQDLSRLLEYADRLGNGAIFKRLGFLLERTAGIEESVLQDCRSKLTTGNATLDPKLASDRLVTRWKLWIPESWVQEPSLD